MSRWEDSVSRRPVYFHGRRAISFHIFLYVRDTVCFLFSLRQWMHTQTCGQQIADRSLPVAEMPFRIGTVSR